MVPWLTWTWLSRTAAGVRGGLWNARRAEELRGQFVPRTLGFTGRHRALAEITQWLDTPADGRPVIVTGDPGSGKTAVLGLLAALADPSRRPTVPRDGLPAHGIPGQDAIGVAIYAGNLTAGQVLAGLAAAAGIEDVNPDPAALGSGLTRLLAGLRGSGPALVAMIDALDEAANPEHLAAELLRPLMERGQGNIRLLLGTRRHVCDHLGRRWQDRCRVIDLDTPGYADPAALAEIIRRTLAGTGVLPDARAAVGTDVRVYAPRVAGRGDRGNRRSGRALVFRRSHPGSHPGGPARPPRPRGPRPGGPAFPGLPALPCAATWTCA